MLFSKRLKEAFNFVNVIKPASSLTVADSENKLECLFLSSFFQPSLIIEGNARSLHYKS